MAVKTWFKPFGATFKMPDLRMDAQSCWGKLPNAGRLIMALAISGDVAAASKAGLE